MKLKYVDAFLDVAERFAKLSSAKRAQVGAIIVKDNRIISIGYNGMPSGWDNVCEECCDGGGPVGAGCYHDHCNGPKTKPEVLHAEANAILKVAKSTNSCDQATLYLTLSPCKECAKLIHQSGIKRLVYLKKYKDTTGLNFLKKAGVIIEQINFENFEK